MGIAHNNLGAAYLAKKDLKKAEDHFQQAVQIAEHLESESKGMENEHKQAKRIHSERLGNLALLRMEQKQFEAAEDLLNQALYFDQETSNHLNQALNRGLKGKLYLAQNRREEAQTWFMSALTSLGEQSHDQNDMEYAVALQIALSHLGEYYLITGDFKQAETYLSKSLTSGRYHDKKTRERATMLLESIQQHHQDHTGSKVVFHLSPKFQHFS